MLNDSKRILRSNKGGLLQFSGLFLPHSTGTALTGTVDIHGSTALGNLNGKHLLLRVGKERGGTVYDVMFGTAAYTITGTGDLTVAATLAQLQYKTLQFQYGGQTCTVTFTAAPASLAAVVAAINAVTIQTVASASTSYLALAAGSPITVTGGTALSLLGITLGTTGTVSWTSHANVAAVATRINSVVGQTVAAAGGTSSYYIVLSSLAISEEGSVTVVGGDAAVTYLGFTLGAQAYQGQTVSTSDYNTARAIVSRSGTGKYTVTFPSKYGEKFGYSAQLHRGTADGYYAQVDSLTLDSSGRAVMIIGTYQNAAGSYAAVDITDEPITWTATVRE